MARFVNDQAVLRRGGGPFRPFADPATLRALLFSANEPGVIFAPTDITTLYQDRAGTTPVTAAGQSVGLRLDKSKGLALGAELVAPLISDALWVQMPATPNSSVSGNQLTFGGQFSGRRYAVNTTNPSSRYEFRFNARRVSGNASIFFFHEASQSGNISPLTLTDTMSSYVIRPQGAAGGGLVSFGFQDRNASGFGTIEVSNISVRELAGNHEVAINDAARGIYGWMPKTGRRNLLTYTEQFDNAAWTKGNSAITQNASVSPDGSTTADLLYPLTTGSDRRVISTTLVLTSVAYTVSAYIKAAGKSWAYMLVPQANTINDVVWFDIYNGAVGTTGSSATAASIHSVGDGWYRCIVTGLADATSVYSINVADSDGSTTATANGTDGIYIWGAQLETGSTATAYQRVVSNYDVTEAGVPSCYYVLANGVNTAYSTPTITPGTDKVQVFAGVRKNSDAASAILVEFSATFSSNNGTFALWSPLNAGAISYAIQSRGTATGTGGTGAAYLAPITNVVTGIGGISGDIASIRVNGETIATGAADQGTGNYLAYPAYIYARGGTTLPFNGYDFGHAVRFGPNLDAATIARVEALIARNTPEVPL